MFEPEVGTLYAGRDGFGLTHYLGVYCKRIGPKLIFAPDYFFLNDNPSYLKFEKAWATEFDDGLVQPREVGFVVSSSRRTRLDDVDDIQLFGDRNNFVLGNLTVDGVERPVIVALPKDFDEHYSLEKRV